MVASQLSRRDYLKAIGVSVVGQLGISDLGFRIDQQTPSSSANPPSTIRDLQSEDRARRMKWWHEAKFGMFIHGGLYSLLGRHEWVMESARLLATGQKIAFQQEPYRVRFTGLPEKAPDDPITTLAIECDGEPRQDEIFVRKRERGQV